MSTIRDPAGERAQRRTWLLLLLDGAERAALTPMPSQQLHRMVYLANCLSPLYDVPIAEGEILKYKRGPIYADLQWDLDRMAVMGLVELSNLRHVRETDGDVWFYADYALSMDGAALIERALAVSESARRRHAFYIEVAGAYAALSEDARDDAALEDANYRHPDARLNTLIDFSARSANFAVRAAESFAEFNPPDLSLSDRSKLHLYFRYLNRMVDKVAG